MYLKFHQLKRKPFLANSKKQFFFPGGGREGVLQHILEDLSNGMTLVHLSGEKGAGKTFMCKMIRGKLRSTTTNVLLLVHSGRGDGKNRNYTLGLGENTAKQIEESELYEKILFLISNCPDSCDTNLLVIDDAEKLPSSLLTQILRLGGDVQPKRKVQFVLAGRLPLGENPELFTAIRGEVQQQFTYTLQPLDRDDTARYLAFRLYTAGIPKEKKDGIFSAEAIARIHEATCGSIGIINKLAEASLRNSYKSKSSIVLLDHVRAPIEISAGLPISDNWYSDTPIIPLKIVTGIIVLIVLVSTAIFWTYNMVKVDNEFKKRIEELSSSFHDGSVTQQDNVPTSPQDVSVSPPLSVTSSEVVKNNQHLVENSSETKPAESNKAKAVLLTAGKNIKIRHQVEERLEQEEKIQTNVNLSGQFTAEELYKKRTIAGDSWIKGKRDDQYTLQLMALKSSNAEVNMKKMLNQKRYRQHANNFYIFKKMTVPETVFVFYGEYKSVAMARLALQSIPEFLKAHKPYVISIKGVVAKLHR